MDLALSSLAGWLFSRHPFATIAALALIAAAVQGVPV